MIFNGVHNREEPLYYRSYAFIYDGYCFEFTLDEFYIDNNTILKYRYINCWYIPKLSLKRNGDYYIKNEKEQRKEAMDYYKKIRNV